ncbi:MAG: DUF1292 domain-containing protein [Lachnospiraceae bacterium]|nr:DUF1292 domain-containing protein [Lachnospiraceae bacterium]
MENKDFQEYVTFYVTTQDGTKVEMAVVDEFEFEHKNYVAAALIEGDTINEEGIYIYKAKIVDDEIVAEKITNKVDYERVVKAYMEME